jgi:CRP/FNR family transcriptional regulator
LPPAATPRTPPPFDALPAELREALHAAGTEGAYVRGDVLLAQGEVSRRLRVILSGRAKLTRDLAAGRTVVLALFGPGDFCGAIPALSGLASDASIVALGPLTALEVEPEAFLALLAGRPERLGQLLPALAGRLTECRNCPVEMTGERVEPRLAALFLRLADECGVVDARGVLVPIRLSRQELADLVGTTLETAIRIFSRWHKSGVLETGDDGFLLVDRGALSRVRGPAPA